MTGHSRSIPLILIVSTLMMLSSWDAKAQLTLITSLADLAQNDAVGWGGEGPSVTNPFNISSLAGNQLSVSQLSGNFEILSGAAFGGNFADTVAQLEIMLCRRS